MKKYFLLFFLVLITTFLAQEFLISENHDFKIFAENNYMLIKTESGNIWGYGNTDSKNAQNLKQNISPYFSQNKIKNIFSLEENKEYLDKQFNLQKISRNLVRVTYDNQVLLFFTEDFNDEDRKKAIKSKLSLKSDWHVLNKNIVLNFLPIPTQGILYISMNNPTQKLKSKSREKNIPLISTKKTQGFSLKFIDNDWKLFSRS